jgi:pilus assembly protein FimV
VNETNCSKFKKRAAALAVASCLSFAPWVVQAAGLGKLTVLSGLGQPLRAELDLGATREELSGMTARLAPQEAFRQAGIDYATVLLDLRFVLDKRANGDPVIKVTSARPVNEPFLDFLVELNWPAGRLVREYTFLLDPPEIAAKQAARPVAEARIVETVRGGGVTPDRPVTTRPEPRAALAPVQPVIAPKRSEPAGTHVVQQGETLRKIATETKYDGVSLEQMLVGLFQKNPDAFMGNNINRLKAGAILGLPDKATVEAVSDAEAKRVYVTQATDWNAYRQKLAAATEKAPAKESPVSQSSAGKITAKVQEKPSPVEQSKDQVKVSRTEMAAAGKAAEDAESDRVARERALKEANERLAMLEQNVIELQKLVEMKNQKLAELQQQNAAKKDLPTPVVPTAPAEPAKVVEPTPVEPPKLAEEAKPAIPEQPVEAPKPVEPKPQPPKAPIPPPEPILEPSFVDTLLEDPVPLAGGAGILALLAGYFLYKRRRAASASQETEPGNSSLGPDGAFRVAGGQSVDTGNTPPQTGDFSQTGPGTIDTDEVDPVAEADVYMAYGRDAQAEEILLEALQKDPQRTAIHAKLLEIYAGRRSLKQFETLASELYAQTAGVGAEWAKVAVLGAALDPNNPLYSGSKQAAPASAPAFDADATMIVSLENAEELASLESVATTAQAESAVVAEELPEMDFAAAVEEMPAVATPQPVAEMVAPEAPEAEMSLDFDLGSPTPAPEMPAAAEPVVAQSAYSEDTLATEVGALDFDLGADLSPAAVSPPAFGELHVPEELNAQSIDFDLSAVDQPDVDTPLEMPDAFASLETSPDLAVEPEAASIADFDFDLKLGEPAAAPAVAASVKEFAATPDVEEITFDTSIDLEQPDVTAVPADDSQDFEVNLTESVGMEQSLMPSDFDIGSINLDLSAEPFEAAPASPASLPEPSADLPDFEASTATFEPAPVVMDENWEEVNTKLDLAKAYEEMGDLEGARELLLEVVSEGTADLVEQARAVLDRIGE